MCEMTCDVLVVSLPMIRTSATNSSVAASWEGGGDDGVEPTPGNWSAMLLNDAGASCPRHGRGSQAIAAATPAMASSRSGDRGVETSCIAAPEPYKLREKRAANRLSCASAAARRRNRPRRNTGLAAKRQGGLRPCNGLGLALTATLAAERRGSCGADAGVRGQAGVLATLVLRNPRAGRTNRTLHASPSQSSQTA